MMGSMRIFICVNELTSGYVRALDVFMWFCNYFHRLEDWLLSRADDRAKLSQTIMNGVDEAVGSHVGDP